MQCNENESTDFPELGRLGFSQRKVKKRKLETINSFPYQPKCLQEG